MSGRSTLSMPAEGMQSYRSRTVQEAETLHTSQLISGDINPRACRRRDSPLSEGPAAARAAIALKLCNDLDHAPRDLLRRTNVAQCVFAWLCVARKAHMASSPSREAPKWVGRSVARCRNQTNALRGPWYKIVCYCTIMPGYSKHVS